ncbi:ABC transporter ATP-binding protein [filamentous cyanobacterium LEGE 11480]|uniref:ABC transporter ATP-binding protein n=1 Tax=Romeriopsis navalis LEGE 11480 TaxID=2777977 RepID=A0A928Z6R5_9CYAN|nr:ABC transporter ATP-binding protein [Romeriopsis navalis]MBE9032480.1 ABC transporter ATP-binding protein [Romeriopsis navalis LEGE 11480]
MARPSRFRHVWNYIRPYRDKVVQGVVALFFVNLLTARIQIEIGAGVDALKNNDYRQVLIYAGWIFGMASVMMGMRLWSRMLLFGVGRQVEFDLKQKIFDHLLIMDPAYFGNNRIGDLINRATSDVDSVRRMLGFAVLSLFNMIFAYCTILPTMLNINVKLSLVAVSVYPIMLLIVNLFAGRMRGLQAQVQEQLSSVSELIQEDMSGIALIKIYAQEANERNAFRSLNRDLLAANMDMAKTRTILFRILEGVVAFSSLLVLWVGAEDLASKTLEIKDFVSLILLTGQLAFPTALMGFTLTAYQRGEVSIDRIETILAEVPQIQDAGNAIAIPPDNLQGQLTAKGLTFTYPAQDQPALDQVNFQIEPGETIAVIGPIGSGKSTLANTMPRLLAIDPGQLFVDGHDVTEMRLQDLRGAIAYVPQESFLFSTSIRDNIRYGNPFAEPFEVEQAAQAAQMDGEIQNFPKQYETMVGERGITLSGGQRQRTALARALVIDSPILILDDALSSVDNQTATKILQNLSTGTRRKTVIFISHQMSAAATADRIFVMDAGKVMQVGTHETLLQESGGLYEKLWNQQKLAAALN